MNMLMAQVDEIFTSVVTSEQALARKVENKSGVSTFDLFDFTVATIHVAVQRYAAMFQAELVGLTLDDRLCIIGLQLIHTDRCRVKPT